MGTEKSLWALVGAMGGGGVRKVGNSSMRVGGKNVAVKPRKQRDVV